MISSIAASRVSGWPRRRRVILKRSPIFSRSTSRRRSFFLLHLGVAKGFDCSGPHEMDLLHGMEADRVDPLPVAPSLLAQEVSIRLYALHAPSRPLRPVHPA